MWIGEQLRIGTGTPVFCPEDRREQRGALRSKTSPGTRMRAEKPGCLRWKIVLPPRHQGRMLTAQLLSQPQNSQLQGLDDRTIQHRAIVPNLFVPYPQDRKPSPLT